MNDFKVKTLDDLTEEQIKVVGAAKSAIENSYSPYSKFEVGAALLLADGSIVTGSNQENMAYPSGTCAERAALFSYGSTGNKNEIKYLAVFARHHGNMALASGAPCGGCRQVMLEYELKQQSAYSVIFYQDGNYIITSSTKTLLPFHFHLEESDE